MQAVLGNNWNMLRAGDIVTMKVIHTPSGRVIWQKDISVQGTVDMANANESAVSPVVGVMLMLVVVIIIAAMVSGFAGSLVGTNTKTPQANIQGTYSYSADIFQMYHAGGDELPTQKIIVKIQQNDEDFGGYGVSSAKWSRREWG